MNAARSRTMLIYTRKAWQMSVLCAQVRSVFTNIQAVCLGVGDGSGDNSRVIMGERRRDGGAGSGGGTARLDQETFIIRQGG